MIQYPHKEKLLAAIDNRKAVADVDILREACLAYDQWIQQMNSLRSTGDEFLSDIVRLGLICKWEDKSCGKLLFISTFVSFNS